MLLVILQNAYREENSYVDREEWLSRLWLSHTGRRLRTMLPDKVDYYVINATPRIGKTPNTCFPADIDHIRVAVDTTKPRLILACGKIAQAGLDILGYKYLSVPHPAWRQLTNRRCKRIRAEIEGRMLKHDKDS